ncbi:hypothetical protein P22_3934 [Propionispora sp. 2/2-37]|uniref:aldose 1-epimerase family protein n=1 Tax=Propionispora sp. 2/2-37 TaxID=1677858 RepID=UPI0006C20E70|nr:aldose 1-epimerase family protein [Propionispora sp. 2/2-37]CUH97788.1 hypothetical protein P22_3934 [Propionispora sp. 2/2-37]
MRYILENEAIRASIDSYGAELRSLAGIKSGREYLWQADPAYWNRTSPVLFPFVGRLKRNQYQYQGKTYPMRQHGFARDQEFAVTAHSAAKIEFMLQDDEETRKVYPFHFQLFISYELAGSKIIVHWRVRNTEKEVMHFSIGSHPAFLCPFTEEEKTCRLQFDQGGPLSYQQLDDNYLCREACNDLPLQDKIWSFEKNVFDHDVLIFPNYQIKQVSILKKNGNPYLTLDFYAPVVGIWSPPKKDAPFICIEPWFGRCDSAEEARCLEEREFNNALSGGAEFSSLWNPD